MTFSVEMQGTDQLSTADGFRLRGTGRVLSSSGDVAVETANATLHVSARVVPDGLIEVARTAVARFGRGSAGAVIHVAPGAHAEARVGTAVSFAREAVATFEFGSEWNRKFDLRTTCAIMSDIYRVLLGDAAGDRDLEPVCDPTFGQCVASAVSTCGAGQVASVTWSCNRQTGETSCSFMCKPLP